MWWVAALDVLAAFEFAFESELILVWGIGCIVLVALFGSFAVRGARHHLRAGRLMRGASAALAAAWSAAIFALPLVSLEANGELRALRWLLAACYSPMLPFATRAIVGGGPVPLDLSAPAAPGVEQGRAPRVAVVTACALSWFDGDMYRSPSELVLRAGSGTFFVSATRDSAKGEELIATFQRRLSPRRQFDPPENRDRILLGSAFAGGAVLAAVAFARARRSSSRARATLTFLLTLSLGSRGDPELAFTARALVVGCNATPRT